MGLLAGEDLTIIKGDIETLKNISFELLGRLKVNDDCTSTSLNLINDRLDYIESYVTSIDNKLKKIEKLLGATYDET